MSKLSFATLTIKRRGDAIAGHLYRRKVSGVLYLAVVPDSSGCIRLCRIEDGKVWSSASTFGNAGAEGFTDLGLVQVEDHGA